MATTSVTMTVSHPGGASGLLEAGVTYQVDSVLAAALIRHGKAVPAGTSWQEAIGPRDYVTRGPGSDQQALDVVYPLRNAAGAVIGLQTSDGEQIEPPARMIVLGTVSGTPRGALTAKAALSAAAGQIGTADSTPTAAEVAALALRVNFVAGVNRAQIAPAAGSVRVAVNALDDVAAFGRLADPVGVDTYVVSAAGPALEIYTGDIDIFALHVVCESGTPVDTTISVVGFAR